MMVLTFMTGFFDRFIVSARCNIYISHLCYNVNVCLSVTDVHLRIIA